MTDTDSRLIGRAKTTGHTHFAVKHTIDGKTSYRAQCNPRVRLIDLDRQDEPWCRRCYPGKAA
jgi:hypothetical protein